MFIESGYKNKQNVFMLLHPNKFFLI